MFLRTKHELRNFDAIRDIRVQHSLYGGKSFEVVVYYTDGKNGEGVGMYPTIDEAMKVLDELEKNILTNGGSVVCLERPKEQSVECPENPKNN